MNKHNVSIQRLRNKQLRLRLVMRMR